MIQLESCDIEEIDLSACAFIILKREGVCTVADFLKIADRIEKQDRRVYVEVMCRLDMLGRLAPSKGVKRR